MTGQTVWLASYPKSGNTWLRAVVAAWRHEDAFTLAGDEPMAATRAALDHALGLATSDLTAGELAGLRPLADDVLDARESRPHLRKIHDALRDDADRLIVSRDATRAAVYLVRDPRDVAVSYAHHSDTTVERAVRHLASPRAAINDDDDLHPQSRQHLGTWSDHVTGWLDRAPFPVHVVRYEDALADPVDAFGGALRAAGFDIGDDELATAVDAASFGRLQRREQEGGFAERWSRTTPFFRRGVAGAWRDELPPAQAAQVVRDHGELMARLGYLDEP